MAIPGRHTTDALPLTSVRWRVRFRHGVELGSHNLIYRRLRGP